LNRATPEETEGNPIFSFLLRQKREDGFPLTPSPEEKKGARSAAKMKYEGGCWTVHRMS
jgi:hypothetical protein